MRFKIKQLAVAIGFIAIALWAWRTIPGWWGVAKEWWLITQSSRLTG